MPDTFPTLVPIHILTRLHAAGVHDTATVLQHIQAGTLQTLRGIGLYWERRIIEAYTTQGESHERP